MYIEGPAAAIALRSDLICYCSIATLACIWYIDFLPPTRFGVSCRSNFWDVWFGKSGLWHCGVGINLKFQWHFHSTLQFFFWDCLGKTQSFCVKVLGRPWMNISSPAFLSATPCWAHDNLCRKFLDCRAMDGRRKPHDVSSEKRHKLWLWPVLATMVYRCQCSSSKSFGCVRTGAEATFTVVNFTMNVGLLTLPCLFAQHGWSTGATEWVDTRTVAGKTRNPRSNTAEIALMTFVHPLCIKPGRRHHGVCRSGMCLHCFVHAGKLLGLFEQVDKLIWACCFFHVSALLILTRTVVEQMFFIFVPSMWVDIPFMKVQRSNILCGNPRKLLIHVDTRSWNRYCLLELMGKWECVPDSWQHSEAWLRWSGRI